MLPSSFSSFFTPISSRHMNESRLASRTTFCIPLVRTNYGRFDIRFKGAFFENNLEESLKSLSLCNFKQSLKNDIVESYFFPSCCCRCFVFQFSFNDDLMCVHVLAFSSYLCLHVTTEKYNLK